MRRGTSATEGAWQNRGSPSRSKDETGSRQLVEQRLGILEDRRVEAFGEPAVDWREEITGFGALALITPEAGEAGRRPKFPRFGLLRTGDLDCLAKAAVGPLVVAPAGQFSIEPVQLGFVVADAGVLNQREGIAQDRLRLIDPTDLATGLGQQGQPMRNLEICATGAISTNTRVQGGDAFLAPPLIDQRPAAQDCRVSGKEGDDLLRR